MGGTATTTGTAYQDQGAQSRTHPGFRRSLPVAGAVLLKPGAPRAHRSPSGPWLCAGIGASAGGCQPGRVSGVKSLCAPAQLGLPVPALSGRGAGTRSVNSTRPCPFPVQLLVFLLQLEPRFSAAPMAALCAALLLARLLLGQLSLVPAWLSGADAQAGQGFELHQPQKMSVVVGETLTLSCTVTAGGPPGPVKWLKGWGNGSETIYDQKDPSTWWMRAVNESNTDFTILIRDVRPEDAGTYYCVKFRKTATGEELFRRGEGTVVEVLVAQGTSPFPSVEVATAVLFFLLVIFILIFCVYHKKCRGEGQSQGPAGARCSTIPVPCCAGSPGPPSDVRDAETPRPPQQSSEQEKDVHYADLQPLREAPQRSQGPGADRSEYASIRAAAK